MKNGRPMTKESMIEHLVMEIEAAADHADDASIGREERARKLQKIRRASVTVISLNNGIRSPKDPTGPRLAEILGEEVVNAVA